MKMKVVDRKNFSPYLSVYKPQYTSIFSIFERITGVYLVLYLIFYFGLLNIITLFISFYSMYNLCYTLFISDIFYINLIFFLNILVFIYHFLFGIRFLYWDRTGGVLSYGINLPTVYFTSNILISFTVILSLIIFTYLII